MKDTWCFLCARTGQGSLATGVDEDGEPACAMHSVKSDEPKKEAQPKVGDIVRPAVSRLQVQPETRTTMQRVLKQAPLCKCGCGKQVNERYGNGTGGWKTYIEGHKPENLQKRDAAAAVTRKKAAKPRRPQNSAKSPSNGHADLAPLTSQEVRQALEDRNQEAMGATVEWIGRLLQKLREDVAALERTEAILRSSLRLSEIDAIQDRTSLPAARM